MKNIWAILVLSGGLLLSGCASQGTRSAIAIGDDRVSFHYEDLDRFAATLRTVDAGRDPAEAYAAYMTEGSAGLRGLAERFNVTVEKFVERVPERRALYAALPSLETPLRARQPVVRAAINRLVDMASLPIDIPVYYIVSAQSGVGGTPVPIYREDGGEDWAVGVAVGLDPNASQELRDAFPAPASRAAMADRIIQIAVHEAAHILQIHAQGEIENYRSIYSDGNGSMLAIAIREGCAEYLTYLASGWRSEDRDAFAEAYERELWSEFRLIMDEPPFSVPGWFSEEHESHPEWPFQIGYSLGFKMCETYHRAAPDPDARLPELFAFYDPETVRRIAAVYENSLGGF